MLLAFARSGWRWPRRLSASPARSRGSVGDLAAAWIRRPTPLPNRASRHPTRSRRPRPSGTSPSRPCRWKCRPPTRFAAERLLLRLLRPDDRRHRFQGPPRPRRRRRRPRLAARRVELRGARAAPRRLLEEDRRTRASSPPPPSPTPSFTTTATSTSASPCVTSTSRSGCGLRACRLGGLAHVPRRRHLPARLLAARQPQHDRRRRRLRLPEETSTRSTPASTSRAVLTSSSRCGWRRPTSSASTTVNVLDRQSFVGSVKLTHSVPLGEAGLKGVLYGEFHHLPAGQRETSPRSTRLPEDQGFVAGGQVTAWTGQRSHLTSSSALRPRSGRLRRAGDAEAAA